MGAAVANRLSNDFIDEHIKERVQSSGDTADFVESELQRLTGRLRELEAQIAQVKSENAGSLPDDVFANQRQVESSFAAFALAQQRLAEAQSDQAFYSAAGDRGARVRARRRRFASSTTTVLSPNQRLQLLENQLGELRSRGFTDKHPDVIATLAEMEQIRERIANAAPKPRRTSAAPTSVAELQSRNEAQRAGTACRGGEREAERLQKEVDAAQARLAATPRVAEQLDALEREYKNLAVSANAFSNKRLEAGVAANMERRQKGEQFRVLEPAYAPPEPDLAEPAAHRHVGPRDRDSARASDSRCCSKPWIPRITTRARSRWRFGCRCWRRSRRSCSTPTACGCGAATCAKPSRRPPSRVSC